MDLNGLTEVRPIALDLSTRESIEEGAAALPPVDLLVNNAGLMTGGLLDEQEIEDVYAMFQVIPATEMLDATRQVYGRHIDAAAWDDQAPADWAAKVVHAIERDDHVLGPGGRLALAKLASRGPAALLDTISGRLFTREPR